MPLFFFRFHTERGDTTNPAGVEFASLADALADAKLALIEYFRDEAVPGYARRNCRIEITDEGGRVLATEPPPDG